MRRAPPAVVVTAALVVAALHLPVVVLAAYSFNRSRFGAAWTGFTLEWYRRLFARADVLAALRVSLTVALIATLAATVLGTLAALALARRRVPARGAIEALIYAPIVTPEIVMGISLLMLFARAGIPLGTTTIVIAHIAFCVSFVVVAVRAHLEGMDGALEEAALTLGANEWTAFRRITLPLAWPGILAGALLAFTMSIDDFVITFFVAGPGSTTLPVLVYSMARRSVDPTINAASTLFVAAAAALALGAGALSRRREARA